VWFREAGEENVLYDRNSGEVHVLNETARAIWELCDGRTSTKEMVEAVCQVTSLHHDVVSEDVDRLLAEFDRVGVISWVED
jgi:PqqD family protein of HPr-rel-A system